MTDLRGTEQELWDEDALADDDAKTAIIDPRAGHQPANSKSSAPVPPAAAGVKSTPAGDAPVDEVARFIAEPGTLLPSKERELDAPRRSLAALELLDAEEGGENSDVRSPPVPPALPADVKPSEPRGLVLGSPSSVRGDVTERVTTIPRTHPMANSLAPGGSPLSTPPAPRRSSRWQVALGVAALLAIGVASRLLQSRGEHHAASGTRADSEEEETSVAEPRLPAPSAVPPAPPPAPSEPAATTTNEAEASARAVAEALESERARASAAAQAVEEQSARKAARAEAEARRVRVGLGGAQLLEREQAAGQASGAAVQPDRAQIVSALSALTPTLQRCVGDEHGIADVTLTVRAPGVVSHALIEGAYAGSDKGSCIARALRSAKLPHFVDPVSRVEYPFQL